MIKLNYLTISDMKMETRTRKILNLVEIKTAYDLVNYDIRGLREVRNCGRKTIVEVEDLQNRLRKIHELVKEIIY